MKWKIGEAKDTDSLQRIVPKLDSDLSLQSSFLGISCLSWLPKRAAPANSFIE